MKAIEREAAKLDQSRPNIIIFNPDQFRADALGHMGNPAAVTPNMDRICAEDGVSFRHAFCQNPVCTPSRCSFMSGWYPHVHGHRTMHHMMRADEPVLLSYLKNNGYYVWWGGKNDLKKKEVPYERYCDYKLKYSNGLEPNLHMVKEWRGDPGSDNYYSFYAGKLDTHGRKVYFDSDWHVISAAQEFISEYHAKEKPFCMFLALNYPHPPYGVEDPWFSMIDRSRLPKRISTPPGWEDKPRILRGIQEGQHLDNWSEERFNELRATYLGMCSRVDYQLGLVIERLRAAGLYESTAILILSDHGDFTGDYGLVEKNQNTFEDCLTRVPFIIKPPAWAEVNPRISDAMVELLDLPATVAELGGFQLDYTQFGKSLIPLLKNDETEIHKAVFCEGGRLKEEKQCKEYESLQAFEDPTESLYYPRITVQCHDDIAHGKAMMLRTKKFKYVKRLYEKDELYDLVKDPQELHNVIGDTGYAPELAGLKDMFSDYLVETADIVPLQTDERVN